MLNLLIIILLAHCSISAGDSFAFMLTKTQEQKTSNNFSSMLEKIEEQNGTPYIGPRWSFSRCSMILDIICSRDLPKVDYIYYGREDYDLTSLLNHFARRKITVDGKPLAQVVSSKEETYALTKAFLRKKHVRPRPVHDVYRSWTAAELCPFILCGGPFVAINKCIDCADYATCPELITAKAAACAFTLGCGFFISHACVHTHKLCDLELVQDEKSE